MSTNKANVLIIGAGIIGLTIARELVFKGIDNIVLLEKEKTLGKHASGRNSGVLHAGIYYSPDSLKARSCLNGNFLMRAYCRQHGLPLLETGKVIVARNAAELPTLKELYDRALANGAKVKMLDLKELQAIEPNAKTYQKALYSSYTAVVDPLEILKNLRAELEASGKVQIMCDCLFKGVARKACVRTNQGTIGYNRLINAAGTHCEKVAQSFGVGFDYSLIPFKGLYYKLKHGKNNLIRSSIYPVPDIRNPFLGVHFTRNVHGDVYLGPTAIPALGRENYGIVEGLDGESLRILAEDAVMFMTNAKFRQVALTEPKKYLKTFFWKDAARLVKRLNPDDIEPSPKVGIRGQLINRKTRELVQDFIVQQTEDTIHILNPVSPAFTSSMDLARKIVQACF